MGPRLIMRSTLGPQRNFQVRAGSALAAWAHAEQHILPRGTAGFPLHGPAAASAPAAARELRPPAPRSRVARREPAAAARPVKSRSISSHAIVEHRHGAAVRARRVPSAPRCRTSQPSTPSARCSRPRCAARPNWWPPGRYAGHQRHVTVSNNVGTEGPSSRAQGARRLPARPRGHAPAAPDGQRPRPVRHRHQRLQQAVRPGASPDLGKISLGRSTF